MCSPLVRPGNLWERGGPGKGVLWSAFVVRSSYPAAPARRPSATSSVRLNPCPCEGVIDAPIPLPAPPLSRVAARHCSPRLRGISLPAVGRQPRLATPLAHVVRTRLGRWFLCHRGRGEQAGCAPGTDPQLGHRADPRPDPD